jgi:hypothetical protein
VMGENCTPSITTVWVGAFAAACAKPDIPSAMHERIVPARRDQRAEAV